MNKKKQATLQQEIIDKTINNINHPQHYKSNGIETIDVIEAFGLGFHLGNAIKYILRAGRKTEDTDTDIKKAVWYLNRYLGEKK